MAKHLIRVYFLLALLAPLCSLAQPSRISAADRKKLRVLEDSLRDYSYYMATDSLPEDRMISDSQFTRTLVRALQVKHSFHYAFDSVQGISRLYAPDSTFRIFTWNLSYDDYYHRQRGAIQMRTADGSLKLFPLRDVSEFTDKAQDSARTRANWIGAVYYNMIRTEHKGRRFYTLFGFDANGAQSSMKWIEVLTFNERNEPVFGGPFFSYAKDSVPKPDQYRVGIEFKKGTRILVNYIPEEEMIFMDHLVSESDQPDLPWTLIPDGDQEGFKWENGKWVHIDKVFTLKLQDGQAPVENPLFDKKGSGLDKLPPKPPVKNLDRENREN